MKALFVLTLGLLTIGLSQASTVCGQSYFNAGSQFVASPGGPTIQPFTAVTPSIVTAPPILAGTAQDETQPAASVSGANACCPTDCAAPGPGFISFNIAGAFGHYRPGGVNTVGGFSNVGEPQYEETLDLGGSMGIEKCLGRGKLRFEFQATAHGATSMDTASFPGPPPPTPFIYNVIIDDRWSALGNIWYEIPLSNRGTSVYAGGGAGAGGGSLTVDDGVVSGFGRFRESVWQFGFGFTRSLSNRTSVDLGYRYIDFGSADVPFNGGFGNYTMDMTSHQVLYSIRFHSLRDLFRR